MVEARIGYHCTWNAGLGLRPYSYERVDARLVILVHVYQASASLKRATGQEHLELEPYTLQDPVEV